MLSSTTAYSVKRRIFELIIIDLLVGAWNIFKDNWQIILFEYTTKTLLLAAIAVVLGTVIGALLSMANMSKIKPLKWIVTAFVEFVRGTPALLQVYVIYFGLPMVFPKINRMDPMIAAFICAAVALTINSAAYVSESDSSNVSLQMYMVSEKEIDKTVEEYFAECEARYKEIFESYTLLEEECGEIEMAGKKARKYVYEIKNGGVTYKQMQAIVVKGGVFYTLTYTATPEKFEDHLADVKMMIAAFKIR